MLEALNAGLLVGNKKLKTWNEKPKTGKTQKFTSKGSDAPKSLQFLMCDNRLAGLAKEVQRHKH